MNSLLNGVIVCIACVITLFSCSQKKAESNRIVISGKLSLIALEKMKIANDTSENAWEGLYIFDEIVGPRGQEEIAVFDDGTWMYVDTLEISSYLVLKSDTYQEVFIMSGDSIYFDMESMTFSGDRKAENTYLLQLEEDLETWDTPDSTNDWFTTAYSQYIDDQVIRANDELMSAPSLDPVFKDIQAEKLKLAKMSERFDKLFAVRNYEHKDPVVEDGYYGFLNNDPYNSGAMLQVPGWFHKVRWLMTGAEEAGILNSRHDNWLSEQVSIISNQELKEAYLLESVKFIVNSDYRDFLDEIVSKAFPLVKNQETINELDSLMLQYKELKTGKYASITSGSEVLQVPLNNQFGRQVSFSDYKGKIILVDVWFTACNPCIGEIPFMKRLEHQYENEEVVFLSISADREQEHEKWKQMIIDKDLGGVQTIAKGGFKSEIVSKYLVRGFPRFMLFDQQGRIFNAFAPRPSNPMLKRQIDYLLANPA